MAARSTRSDEPPCETSGSGTPVTGKRASTTPMFMNACPQIHAVTPMAMRAPNVSGARREMRMPRTARAMKASSTSSAPRSPNSWPITAKM